MTVERWKTCLAFEDHGLFFLRTQQNLLWLFLLLLIWDERAAADNKTRRFVFQSSATCWLLNRNSTSCWFFSFVCWPWIIRGATYDWKTAFRIGSNWFDWWCQWCLIGFIFSFPWIIQNTFCIRTKNWAVFLSFQVFSVWTHNPHGFLVCVCFHMVPRVFIWFCK